MKKRILGVIAGLFAGFVVTSLLQILSSILYPMPEGIDMNDMEAMKKFVASLPAGAFLIVLFSHAAGAMTATFVCTRILQSKWVLGTLLIGGLLFLAGIGNLLMIPHPVWFAVLDLLLYFPAAFLGMNLAARPFSNPS